MKELEEFIFNEIKRISDKKFEGDRKTYLSGDGFTDNTRLQTIFYK